MESIALGAARRAAPLLTILAVQWTALAVRADQGVGLPTFLVLPEKPPLRETKQIERLPLVELELKEPVQASPPAAGTPRRLPPKPRRRQLQPASVHGASSYLRSVVVAPDEFVGLSASPQLPLRLREDTVQLEPQAKQAKHASQDANAGPVSSVDPALVAHLFPKLPRVVAAPADSPFAAPVGRPPREPVVVAVPRPAKPPAADSGFEPVVVAVKPRESNRAAGADLGESAPPAALAKAPVRTPAPVEWPRETARSRWLAEQLAPKPAPQVIEGFPGTPDLEALVRERQTTRIPREPEQKSLAQERDAAEVAEIAVLPPEQTVVPEEVIVPEEPQNPPVAGPEAIASLPPDPATPAPEPTENLVANGPPTAESNDVAVWALPQLEVTAPPTQDRVANTWTQDVPAMDVPDPFAPIVSPIAPPVAAQVPVREDTLASDPTWDAGRLETQPLPVTDVRGGAWEPVDLSGVELETKQPAEAAPASVAVAEDRLLAEKAVQHGFELAQRRAHFSARARFIEALRVVARSLDEQSYGTRHTKALKRALTAYDEAADFFPQSYRPDQEVNLAMAIGGHNTSVLHKVDPDLLTPNQCAREYLALAEQEFVAALGRDPQGAQALYGLGRLESAVATTASNAEVLRAQRSMVLYQASLLVDQTNFAAANELGVLLARYAKYEQAIVAWQHCLAHSPQSTAWANLASVYDKLGRRAEAEHALRQARQTVGQEPSLPFVANRPSVEWVDPQAFLSAPTQVLPAMPQQVARPEVPQADPPRNAPPLRTATKPRKPRIFGFGR